MLNLYHTPTCGRVLKTKKLTLLEAQASDHDKLHAESVD
jgi:hypothetical protein